MKAKELTRKIRGSVKCQETIDNYIDELIEVICLKPYDAAEELPKEFSDDWMLVVAKLHPDYDDDGFYMSRNWFSKKNAE